MEPWPHAFNPNPLGIFTRKYPESTKIHQFCHTQNAGVLNPSESTSVDIGHILNLPKSTTNFLVDFGRFRIPCSHENLYSIYVFLQNCLRVPGHPKISNFGYPVITENTQPYTCMCALFVLLNVLDCVHTLYIFPRYMYSNSKWIHVPVHVYTYMSYQSHFNNKLCAMRDYMYVQNLSILFLLLHVGVRATAQTPPLLPLLDETYRTKIIKKCKVHRSFKLDLSFEYEIDIVLKP